MRKELHLQYVCVCQLVGVHGSSRSSTHHFRDVNGTPVLDVHEHAGSGGYVVIPIMREHMASWLVCMCVYVCECVRACAHTCARSGSSPGKRVPEVAPAEQGQLVQRWLWLGKVQYSNVALGSFISISVD